MEISSPEMASKGNVIHDSAELNEAIKQVVRLSRQVYLGSLNAMFTARTAGGSAQGFVRVTAQLRSFSSQLGQVMGQLQQEVERLVEYAVEYQRDMHYGDLATAALQQCSDGARQLAMAGFRRRVLDKREYRMKRLEEARAQVGNAVKRALRLCQIGASLAVLGKIEAGSAGATAEARLRSVADETGLTVEAIESLLLEALHHLGGRRELAA